MSASFFVAIGFFWLGAYLTLEAIKDYRHTAQMQAAGANPNWTWVFLAILLISFSFGASFFAIYIGLG